MNFSEPFIKRPIGTTLLAIGLLLVGHRRLSLPAGRQPADRRVADHPRHREPARRRPRDHGGDRRGAAGAPARRDRGRDRDHLGAARSARPASPCSSTSRATSTARRATCRPRSTPRRPTCRATCRRCRRFRKVNPAAAPMLILALTSKTLPPSAIYDAADTVIAQRISQVDGVADVTVSGAEQPAIRVRVNPDALASMGICSRTCARRSPAPTR